MLLGIRKEKLTLLENVHRNFRTFLLSNTNTLHLKWIRNYLLSTYGRPDLNSLFDKIYYSCETGYRKPQPELFLKIISENNLTPAATLFIDDSIQNIEPARAAGFVPLYYSPSEDLRLFLEQHLNRNLNSEN